MASRHPLAEIREGAGFVFRHRLLRPVFVTQFVFNAAFFILQAVYVPYAVRSLGLSASIIGATLATYGVGMILGALLAGRIIRVLPFGIVIALGPIAGLAAALVMVATIWRPSALLAGASFFLMGIGPIVWVITTATLRQSVTPRALLGRVSAINITTYGARPLGAAIGAVVGSVYGAETCLVVAALGFLIQAAVIVTSPVIGLARQPDMIAQMLGGVVAFTVFLGLLLVVLLLLNRRDRRRAAIAAALADCLDDQELRGLLAPKVGLEGFHARARVTLDMRGCVAQEVRQVAVRCMAGAPESVSVWIRVR